jgi:type I restriction enzyme S subunit
MAKLERTYDRISYLKYFPEHWEVARIKNVFEEIDERSEDGTEELLSVSHYTGVTLKRDSLENEDDFDQCKNIRRL